MLDLPVGEWMPDAATMDNSVVTVARNVVPTTGGYGPIKGLNQYSIPLPGHCFGFFAAKLASGGYAVYAGTKTKLYKMGAGGAFWTDVSGAFTFDVPDSDLWSFAQFGSALIATNVNLAQPVTINVDIGTTFSALGGSPPAARGVAVVGDFLVLYGLASNKRIIQWSGLNDITEWTPGTNFSDYQEFPDGGDVTGFCGGEYGIVFQTSATRRMIFLPEDTTNAFRFVKLTDEVGCVGPWACIRVADTIYSLDSSGFYAYAGAGGVPVGGGSLQSGGIETMSSGRITDWFFKNADQNALARVLAAADTKGSRVYWFFKSTDGASQILFDKAVIYDRKLNRFSYAEVTVEYVSTASTAPLSLDSEAGSIDTETGSLDDAELNTYSYQFAAFDASHKVSFFSGPNMEAVIETSDGFIGKPGLTKVKGIRPDIDALDYRVSLSSRMSLGAVVAYSDEAEPSVNGVCHIRRAARYHRARVRIPQGTGWTFLKSIGVDAIQAGNR